MYPTYQYITVDSRLLDNNNNFVLNFIQPLPPSNLILGEIDNVVGMKIIDFYVSNVNTPTLTSTNIQYIDILCPDIPSVAQINEPRHGHILDRIFMKRVENSIYSKTYRPFYRNNNMFNPLFLSKLQFKIYNMKAGSTYELLDPNIAFSMTLELATINSRHMLDL